jgi:uncharacterized SAM-binding protein YcdF (DUF218 family)
MALAAVVISVPLFWFLILTFAIWTYSGENYAGPADAAIVLGAAVWNGHPSPVFEERINHAVALYKAGRIRALILTGGIGEGDLLAESEVARDYAIKQGVPAQHIYHETVSRITYENLLEAKKIADSHDCRRILVVSDPPHMKRSVTMARDLGMDAHPSPTAGSRYRSSGSKLCFLLRETCFYAVYLLKRPFVHRALRTGSNHVQGQASA